MDKLTPDRERFPFIFGSQYYRAPTPEPECWETDFRNMRDLGFNEVKYFVQWRWSHRAPDRFTFDDLDRLMDLAAGHGLGVTLNIILDVAPVWLFQTYPDVNQIDSSGHVFEPYAVAPRAIGGHPGPCYNHPGALRERQRFVTVVIEHFRDHPALHMWDMWNEPELCFPQRTPNLATMACYCPHCHRGFAAWLRAKYGELERLNAVWGRCYETWEEIELPRSTGTITDFIDWREFHLEVLAGEAVWRLETCRRLDSRHGRYLHVVPNRWFSQVTCADDFAMAKPCEVFAASMNGSIGTLPYILSAARGKVCYNVESHQNFGGLNMHQRVLEMNQALHDFLPELGAGIKGILFWQYRSEVLGAEAPAWGLVKLDGSARPITEIVRRFWATLRPRAADLRKAFPAPAKVGIWRSRKNDIFHFCAQGWPNDFNNMIEAYVQALYWDNVPHALVNGDMLANGELDGRRLLIMPSAYYMTQAEATALDRWVRNGGILLCEAHLAGYNGTTGRHSRALPGCGLAESWGLRETESTSSFHLRAAQSMPLENEQALSDDVRKALKEFGVAGGKFFPLHLTSGQLVWGAHRYAELGGDDLDSLGTFDGSTPCLARKSVGKGTVFYCGTNLGQAAERDPAGLKAILAMALTAAGIEPVANLCPEQPGTVHLDILAKDETPRFAVLISRTDHEQAIRLQGQGSWRGLFSGITWKLKGETRLKVPADFAEIFVIDTVPAGRRKRT